MSNATLSNTTAPNNFVTARNTGPRPIPEAYDGNPARGIVLGVVFALFLVWPVIVSLAVLLIGGH